MQKQSDPRATFRVTRKGRLICNSCTDIVVSYPQDTAYCGHAKDQRNAGLGRFYQLSSLNQPDLRPDFGLRK